MKLKAVIDKFEEGRKSSDDYKEIHYHDLSGCVRSVKYNEIQYFLNCDVVSKKMFKGRVMDFSLSSLSLSKERICRAISIFINDEQAQNVEEFLKRKHMEEKKPIKRKMYKVFGNK